MAIYVSDGDLTLSTSTTGWLRSEEYKLPNWNTSINTYRGLSSTYTTNQILSFANDCNCSGAILWFVASANMTTSPSLVVRLQEALSPVTFDVTNDKVQYTSHGLSDGDEVSFTSSGTLPGGINANYIYYVINSTTDDFEISTTAGGSKIDLTGTPSGTHTLWVVRRKSTKTPSDLGGIFYNSAPVKVNAAYFFSWTPIAVTTASDTWRLAVMVEGGSGLSVIYQDASLTIMGRIMVTDYLSGKPGSSDTAVIKDTVTMDENWSLGYTQDVTNYAVSMIIPMGGKFELENPPSDKYTLTINGFIDLSGGIFQVGSSDSPISPDKQFHLNFTRPGSSITGFYNQYASELTVRKWGVGKLLLYGSVTKQVGFLENKALKSQANLVLTEDLSSYISPGDSLKILGGQLVSAGSTNSVENKTVSSVSGKTVTLTSNLSYDHDAGWVVCIVKDSLYGIKITTTGGWNLLLTQATDIILWGVYIYSSSNTSFSNVSNASYTVYRRSTREFKKCFFYLLYFNWNLFSNNFYSLVFEDCIFYTTINSNANYFDANNGIMTRCYFMETFAQTSVTLTIAHNWIISYCQFSGCSVGDVNGYAIGSNSINLQISNCRFNQVGYALGGNFYGLRLTDCIFDCMSGAVWNAINGTDCILKNCIVAPNLGSKEVVKIYQYAYLNNIYVLDPTGAVVSSTTYQPDMINGSIIRFHNISSNQHYVYKRQGFIISTGSGLSDTTVHTSGTGKFAVRFEPTSSSDNLEWSFTVPTGNIQDKTMTVAVWCKVNSSNYWGGDYLSNAEINN